MRATGRGELPTPLYQAALLGLCVAFGLLAGGHPKMAVAAAFGLAFVAFVLVDLTLGLCIFTVVAFIDLLPSFGAAVFSFAKLTGLLLAASWAGMVATRGRERRGFVATHPTAFYALALFMLWAGLSYLWAELPSVVVSEWIRYALNAFLFLIVFAAVRERRHVKWVIAAFVAACGVSAAYGIMSPPAATPEAELVRLSGTVGDANEFAAALVAGLVLSLALAIALRRAPLARGALLLAAGVCVLGIFLSLSRGGLIALFVALVAAVAFAGRWRTLVSAGAVLLALATVGWFAFVATPDQRDRVTNVQEGGSGRSDIWTVGMRMVRDNTVEGVGAGNFQTSSVHYLIEPGALRRDDQIIERPKVAHNMYLHVLAELGVVGLVLFLGVIFWALSCAWRAARLYGAHGDLRMEVIARGVLIALIGLLTADFFISGQFAKQLWLLLGLCPALLAIARGSRVGAPSRLMGLRPRWSEAPPISAGDPAAAR